LINVTKERINSSIARITVEIPVKTTTYGHESSPIISQTRRLNDFEIVCL